MDNWFGVVEFETTGEYAHYVGHDPVLWDWLVADNMLLNNRMGSSFLVPAPQGYVFNEAGAVVRYYPAYGEVQELPDDERPALTRTAYVHVGPTRSRADKARMLVREESDVLSFVVPAEFKALRIDEARILDVRFF